LGRDTSLGPSSLFFGGINMSEEKTFEQMTCHIFKDYGITFDEKGSTWGTVRKVQWIKNNKEPDENKAKIEIRKFTQTSEGERMMKGYTFSTPEGPGELVVGLIDAGFGDTKDILRAVRKRDDFLESAKHINEDKYDNDSGESFDMRDLLLGMVDEEE
jgi:hypothetical protein